MRQIRGFRGHSRSVEATATAVATGPAGVGSAQHGGAPGPVAPATYLPLRDYGIIGDMRTAALVGRDGSIDWCCFPRFDSPSVFARILDARRGGFWSVGPARSDGDRGPRGIQRYDEGTNVLVTRFEEAGGVLEVTDFMPVLEWDRQLASHHEIHRVLHVPEGRVRIAVRFRPRFDYGVRRPRFRLRRHGVLAWDGEREVLTVAGDAPGRWSVDEGTGEARLELELSAGETARLVLRHDDDEVWPPRDYDSEAKLARTRLFWRDWVSGIRYSGPYREAVERSALALKLLFYAPTGAVVAAPTTSLPEEIGGSRNWDYRYSWLRDSTYTLFALHALGKFEELDRYMGYLRKVCRREADGLQIMYGIGGERQLPERELDHLEGYRGSRPVRAGNAAVDQLQLDIYGEVMDSIHIWRRHHPMTEGMWSLCRRLARDVMENWRRPDLGVWEVRTEPRHFIFSKVMCWVAMDRAIRAAEELGLPAELDAWRRCRAEIRAEVLERGWSEERGAFVQHYGSRDLDAANLLLPIVRFLPHDDPRIRGTIERIAEELAHPSGLLYRYRSPDGLCGSEGTFCMNTFHLSQALALAGQHERARDFFERVLAHASPLGLLSEEIDPDTGELLGNYPQAFSHIGLVNAAHVLSRTRPERTADDYPLLDDGDVSTRLTARRHPA